MKPAEFFEQTLKHTNRAVIKIKPDQWHKSTPDTEWNLRTLLNHMVYELVWVPDLLIGKTVAEVGDKYEGDVLGKNPLESWRKAMHSAIASAYRVDPQSEVHLSYGDVSAEHYIYENGGDIFIHGWDVAKAIGADDTLEPKLAEILYDKVLPRADEFAASGLFGTPIEVPDDADIATKLLALFGRKNNKNLPD